jgi:predicted ABC-type ATPase
MKTGTRSRKSSLAKRPSCYVIAGPNWAGKTTFALEFLPNHVGCFEFINPDMIAKGFSPFDPERIAVKAGRLVLERIQEMVGRQMDFGFESTLSGRTYMRLFRKLKSAGYTIHMIYVWLPSPELALLRIQHRVGLGGHDVPEADVRCRFVRTARNFESYRRLVDSVLFFDNFNEVPILVFEESQHQHLVIHEPRLYRAFLREATL